MRASSHRRYGEEGPLGDVSAGPLWALVTAFHLSGQGRASPGEALASCGSAGQACATRPSRGCGSGAGPIEGSGVGRLVGIAAGSLSARGGFARTSSSKLLPILLLVETVLRFVRSTKAVLWKNVKTISCLNVQQNETEMGFFLSI